MKATPTLCTALLAVIESWREHQQAVGYSDSRGELTIEEVATRQNYEAALEQFEQATQTNTQEAA